MQGEVLNNNRRVRSILVVLSMAATAVVAGALGAQATFCDNEGSIWEDMVDIPFTTFSVGYDLNATNGPAAFYGNYSVCFHDSMTGTTVQDSVSLINPGDGIGLPSDGVYVRNNICVNSCLPYLPNQTGVGTGLKPTEIVNSCGNGSACVRDQKVKVNGAEVARTSNHTGVNGNLQVPQLEGNGEELCVVICPVDSGYRVDGGSVDLLVNTTTGNPTLRINVCASVGIDPPPPPCQPVFE